MQSTINMYTAEYFVMECIENLQLNNNSTPSQNGQTVCNHTTSLKFELNTSITLSKLSLTIVSHEFN